MFISTQIVLDYELTDFKTLHVISPQLRQFYSNWLGKADAYDQDTLANHFDKFTSLYVVFNSLYLQVMTELVMNGEKLPKEYKDKKAATDYVAQFIKGKYFVSQLLNDDLSVSNLTSICTIIENEEFHIILDYGIPQRALDLELLTFLRSNASQEKAKAILSLFYHIRCNLFHGQKGFEERQRQLLVPVNQLLRKTVVITFDKLDT